MACPAGRAHPAIQALLRRWEDLDLNLSSQVQQQAVECLGRCWVKVIKRILVGLAMPEQCITDVYWLLKTCFTKRPRTEAFVAHRCYKLFKCSMHSLFSFFTNWIISVFRNWHYKCRRSGHQVRMCENEASAAPYREQNIQDDARRWWAFLFWSWLGSQLLGPLCPQSPSHKKPANQTSCSGVSNP